MAEGTDGTGRLRRWATPGIIPAEMALASVTLAVIFGFSRVFEGWSFIAPLIAMALVGHTLVAVARRLGWGVTISASVYLGAWTLGASWTWFPDTMRHGLPTGATLDEARIAINSAWEAFRELSAPVPAYTGFLVIASLALAFSIFLADWAAFRLWSTIEALITSMALFIFFTLLASDTMRVASAVAFAVAALTHVIVHRATRLHDDPAWIQGTARRATTRFVDVAAVLGILAVLTALVMGPHIPGVDEDALVDLRSSHGTTSPRTTVSPLVDIRSRLVDQSDTVLFEVHASEKAYWRLTALDRFDGTIWSSDAGFAPADGALDAPGVDRGDTSYQSFEIANLGALWLPAAYRPVDLDAHGARIRFNTDSATLIVDDSYQSSDGLSYEVTSVLPQHSAATLGSTLTDEIPEDVAQHYAAEPPGLSEQARGLATAVAGAYAGNPYEQSLALQSFFRENFTYDLTVEPGHSDNAIDDFLDRRRGYCEQFAGTFAAMARHLGLPARVAVGFTWGDEDPQDPSHFTVKGRHAHAWPEVYLADAGWVAFEPTPDRGMPGATAWTGLAPSQADQGPDEATTSRSEPTVTTTTVTTSTTTPSEPDERAASPSAPSTRPPNESTAESATAGPASTADTARNRSGHTGTILAVSAICLLIAGYVLVVIVVPTRRHNARREQARHSNAARVTLAWRESVDALALVGAHHEPGQTRDEYGCAVAGIMVGIAPQLAARFGELSHDADLAMFSATGVDEVTADSADATRDLVISFVEAHTSRWRRILARLDPRNLSSARSA